MGTSSWDPLILSQKITPGVVSLIEDWPLKGQLRHKLEMASHGVGVLSPKMWYTLNQQQLYGAVSPAAKTRSPEISLK